MGELLQQLAREVGVAESGVRRLMLSAPRRYKVYNILKRTGGLREIAQPAREVKILQRALCEVLLKRLPVHPAATAYVDGKSIADNARVHADSGPIMKMDFRNFFPSIVRKDWYQYCEETRCLIDVEEIELTGALLFRRPKGSTELKLAIGAPSSPMLSNILMYKFDEIVSSLILADKKIKYTRYADDLTFSAPKTGFLVNVKKYVFQAISEVKYPRLQINSQKTVVATKKYRRSVTGLVITNDGAISIGRDRKRAIRSLVYRAANGNLDAVDLAKLSGTLAFANSVEPNFINSLREKYSNEVIASIQAAPRVKRADVVRKRRLALRRRLRPDELL